MNEKTRLRRSGADDQVKAVPGTKGSSAGNPRYAVGLDFTPFGLYGGCFFVSFQTGGFSEIHSPTSRRNKVP